MSITNQTTGKTFFPAEEYAAIAGYHVVYVRKQCTEGKIPGAVKRRGAWLIPEETLMAKLKSDPVYGPDETDLPEEMIDQPLNLDITDDDILDDL